MCFSTTASFVAGTVLATIGTVCLKKAETRSQLMFALIPMLFAIQQFAEGFVWLSLTHDKPPLSQFISAHLFLFFAVVVWPWWVPAALYLIEKKNNRKKILGVLLVGGLLFSLSATIFLFINPSSARIAYHHIKYDFKITENLLIGAGIFYLIPTILSHFFSSIKGVPFMGVLVVLSYVVTRLLFNDNLLSVWCFFAALVSITICYILIKQARKNRIQTDKK